VFQSWGWLNSWWSSWGEGREFIVVIKEDERLVGAAALYLDEKRNLRLIGEEHADYGAVLAVDDRKDILEAIVKAIFEQRECFSRLIFDAVRQDSYLHRLLLWRGAVSGEAIVCPRVQFAKRPLQSLLSKSSLKRHAKALSALGEVQCLHCDTAQTMAPWLDGFFQQHIERWALTGSPSLFLNPKNRAFYRALASRARAGGPALLSVVLLAGRPVAMHFGFRSQKDLLWYKSTFDPRLATAGPGEVLLANLLREAAAEGCAGVDFTRGGESFKSRFASETRYVSALEVFSPVWNTMSARGQSSLRGALLRALDHLQLRASVAQGLRGAHRAVALWQRQGAHTLFKRAQELWQARKMVPVRFYARKQHVAPTVVELADGFSGCCVESIAQLFERANPRDSRYRHLFETASARLGAGDRLWLGLVQGDIVAFGWETQRSPLPVTEIGEIVHFEANTTLLYDFQVLLAYRGRGYYQALLRWLTPLARHRWTVIFARADNLASCAGIEASGFRCFSALTRRRGIVEQALAAKTQGPVLTVGSCASQGLK
jgi:CelD/BcsL family acetyltransferase involved in cellulose biosynthesis/GNAT superfamily N-acetyltransferase